jgi:hypothetical protein
MLYPKTISEPLVCQAHDTVDPAPHDLLRSAAKKLSARPIGSFMVIPRLPNDP